MALQPARWGQGARGGFRHGSWFSPTPRAGLWLLLLHQGTPGDLALCSPVSWGFPQSFALSGLQAARQCEMNGPVHTMATGRLSL